MHIKLLNYTKVLSRRRKKCPRLESLHFAFNFISQIPVWMVS